MLQQAESREKTAKALQKSKVGKITYQKLFWLFMIGSVIGIVAEGIWCVLTKGIWEYHPATIWGPFCIVYGIGAVAVYILSVFLRGKNLSVQFISYTVAGGLVEYVSSWVQELVFHSTSWDYSDHILNIGGRVSLQMTLIWGVLGILFMRLIMPLLENVFEKMQGKSWQIACFGLSVYMVMNLTVTSAALLRWRDRQAGIPASNQIVQYLDDAYDNETMEKRYCNMKFE